ncbi:hypothetical protein [Alicyclobacillus sp. ALC3]|uniref:hypothetical protein n=1 Tax=Alicyclobacillus sp. ALC3 TaxID=2796143 RepID=UPI00237850F6|nr:hypothetical protein [Alicyclobacillus sp. ALC3]WDL95699.1 hypothetical protein JC200_15140 [Alicyclobacillus sp. ALC3]
MSWTQGQSNRGNQSPYVDFENDERNRRPNYSNRRQNQVTTSTPGNVAATFTQEGLSTFASIFSTAVEAAIAKSLPEVVEHAVERKLQDVLHVVHSEVDRLAAELVAKITEQTQATIGAFLKESFKTEQVDLQMHDAPLSEETSAGNSQSNQVNRSTTELNALIDTLKAIGQPIKASELPALVKEVEWGKNPSMKMTNLMHKSNGQIERVGRGLYGYKNIGENGPASS